MGKLDGQVAFITGVARGQGRSHAVMLASEGADIIGADLCGPIESASYPGSTSEDLAETQAQVEALGRKMAAYEVDVRDRVGLERAFADGVSRLGAVDIVVANAGVALFAVSEHRNAWQDTLDINLTGVYNTVEVALPSMIERDRGGSIILVSSLAGTRGAMAHTPGSLAYGATKHAVIGLMRNYANILAPARIRVNTVNPSGVATPMVLESDVMEFIEFHGVQDQWRVPMPLDLLDPMDVSRAVIYLASDDGRWVTGTSMKIDGGSANKA